MTQGTQDHPRFDSEAEVLLREVARDPHSWLLRVPRRRIEEVASEDSPVVSDFAARLTSSERELLEVHRCEVAHLLRQACRRRLAEASESKNLISIHYTATRVVQIPSADSLRFEVGTQSITGNADSAVLGGITLLEQCVASKAGRVPTIAELASASLRLEPTDDGRLQLALDFLLRGRAHSAVDAFTSVLEGSASPWKRSLAAENRGLALEHLGCLEEAVADLDLAHLLAPERVTPPMYALVHSIRLVQPKALDRWVQVVDDLMRPDDAAVAWYCDSLRLRRPQGGWGLSTESRDLVGRISFEPNTAARRIIHAVIH